MRIIIDGRHLYDGHPLAWRSGTIDASAGTRHGLGNGNLFFDVTLDITGNEKKHKIAKFPGCWLCIETEQLKILLATNKSNKD